MESLLHRLVHQSVIRCYQRSLLNYQVFLILQTLQLPIPDLPGSHHLQEVYMYDNLYSEVLQQVPYQLQQRFPVLKIRWTYLLQGFSSYQDVPVNKIRHVLMLTGLL